MLAWRLLAAPAALVFGWLAAASDASAQESASCNPAYESADLLLHSSSAGKLLEARAQLRTCASPSCKAWMTRDCTQWLSEVERRIPTVVFTARESDGTNLTEVSVSADDTVIAPRLDGQAVEMNPGSRLFVFLASDGRRVEQRASVVEGEKAQLVSVTFPKAGGGAAGAEVPQDAGQASPGGAARRRAPWRTVGFVAGGVGVAGLAVGAVFGLMAISKNGDSNADNHCQNDFCDATGKSLRNDALGDATISTVAFAAGAALTAAGVVLVLTSAPPRPNNAGAAAVAAPAPPGQVRVALAPAIGRNGTGLAIAGEW